MEIVEKLIFIKRTLRISQKDLAIKLNVSRQTVSRWMNRKVKPSGESLFMIDKMYQELSSLVKAAA